MGKLFFTVLCVFCVLIVLAIFAVDRVFFRLGEIEERLFALENRLAEGGSFVAAPQRENRVSGVFANHEYMAAERSYDGTMTLAVSADVPNLNQLTSQEAGASMIHSFCNSTLAERNYDRLEEFEPVLAESWSVSEDGLIYTVKLRKDVYWHDFVDIETGIVHKNVEMTADDFAFFFEVLSDERVNCAPLRVYYQGVKDFKVVNDYEFQISWREPYFKLEELTLGLSPLPRHFYCPGGVFDPEKFNYDAARNSEFIGVGPYRLTDRSRDVSITLERNENYFGKKYGALPGIKRIVLVVNKLESTRFQGLLAGDLDMIMLTPDQWINRTGSKRFTATLRNGDPALDAAKIPGNDGNFVRCETGGGSYSYIAWNQRSPLFRDRETRQALTMLVDRERLLKDIYFGLGQIAEGPFSPGTPGDDPELEPWPFDPAAAAALLSRAGWEDRDGDGYLDRDGNKFSFSVMQVANHPAQEKILPVIKEELARAGIEMRIDIYEWSVFLERINSRNFEACMLAWTTPLEPDPYQVWHSSQAFAEESSNFISFCNPEADRLIEEIRQCTDAAKRTLLCREFQRLIHKEQPYTFMFVPSQLSAVSAKFNNIRIFPPYMMPETLMWSEF